MFSVHTFSSILHGMLLGVGSLLTIPMKLKVIDLKEHMSSKEHYFHRWMKGIIQLDEE